MVIFLVGSSKGTCSKVTLSASTATRVKILLAGWSLTVKLLPTFRSNNWAAKNIGFFACCKSKATSLESWVPEPLGLDVLAAAPALVACAKSSL